MVIDAGSDGTFAFPPLPDPPVPLWVLEGLFGLGLALPFLVPFVLGLRGGSAKRAVLLGWWFFVCFAVYYDFVGGIAATNFYGSHVGSEWFADTPTTVGAVVGGWMFPLTAFWIGSLIRPLGLYLLHHRRRHQPPPARRRFRHFAHVATAVGVAGPPAIGVWLMGAAEAWDLVHRPTDRHVIERMAEFLEAEYREQGKFPPKGDLGRVIDERGGDQGWKSSYYVNPTPDSYVFGSYLSPLRLFGAPGQVELRELVGAEADEHWVRSD